MSGCLPLNIFLCCVTVHIFKVGTWSSNITEKSYPRHTTYSRENVWYNNGSPLDKSLTLRCLIRKECKYSFQFQKEFSLKFLHGKLQSALMVVLPWFCILVNKILQNKHVSSIFMVKSVKGNGKPSVKLRNDPFSFQLEDRKFLNSEKYEGAHRYI